MIRHFVLFTARSPDVIPAMVAGLRPLATIAHARCVEIGINAHRDQLAAVSQPADVIVYAEFDDAEAFAAYQSHPTYLHAISVVRPLRDQRWVGQLDTD